MPRLAIKLFGPPQIELDSAPLDLDHHKPVALLCYLAVSGQRHTRLELAALFWPEYENARTYLRNNLWIIRRALGPLAPTCLLVKREMVGWQADVPIDLDIAAFRRHLAAARAHQHAGQRLCGECLSHWQAALALAQAEFMSGWVGWRRRRIS